MSYLAGHRNEGVEYVKKMPSQRSSHDLEYPNDTNMRGGARAGGKRGENDRVEHHAEGDMVGDESKKRGGHVERHAMGEPVGSRPFGPRPVGMPRSGAMMRAPEAEGAVPMKKGGRMRKKDCDDRD